MKPSEETQPIPVLVHWNKPQSDSLSGELTPLTMAMWKKLENTDSFPATTMRKALAYGGDKVGDVVRAVKSGEPIETPVVTKLENGVYWLTSGNEVLLAMRALQITPVINLQIPESSEGPTPTDESLQNLEIHTEAIDRSKNQQPSLSDLESAIDHADAEQEGWSLEDFHLSFLGNLSVEDLYQYDDVDSWLDVDPSDYANLSVKDRLRQLAGFRGSEWVTRAAKWVNAGIPPIVIIESPDGMIQIGDGRGRVNFALAMDMRLPVYLLQHKNMTEAIGLSMGGAGLAASGQVSGGPTSGGVLWSDKDKKKDVKTASPALHELSLSGNGTQPIEREEETPLPSQMGYERVGKNIYVQSDDPTADRTKAVLKDKSTKGHVGLSKSEPITGISVVKERVAMKTVQKKLEEDRRKLEKLVESRLNLLESNLLTEDKHVKMCELKLVKEMRQLMEAMLKEEISKMEVSEMKQLVTAAKSLATGNVATGSATQVGGHRIPKVATVENLVDLDLMNKVLAGYESIQTKQAAVIKQAMVSRAQGGALQQINMNPNLHRFETHLVTNIAKLAKFFSALTKASGLIKSGKTQTEKPAAFREMTTVFQTVEGLDARETALAIVSLDKESQTGLARFANDVFRTTNLQNLMQGLKDKTTDYHPRDEYGSIVDRMDDGGPQPNASAPSVSISPEDSIPPTAAPSVFQRARNWFSSRFASNPSAPPPLTVPPPRTPAPASSVPSPKSASPVPPPLPPRKRSIQAPGMTV